VNITIGHHQYVVLLAALVRRAGDQQGPAKTAIAASVLPDSGPLLGLTFFVVQGF